MNIEHYQKMKLYVEDKDIVYLASVYTSDGKQLISMEHPATSSLEKSKQNMNEFKEYLDRQRIEYIK